MTHNRIFFIVSFLLLNTICIAVELKQDVIEEHFSLSWIDKQSVLIQKFATDKNWLYSFKTGNLTALPERSTNTGASPSPSGQFLFSTNWSFEKLSLIDLHKTHSINQIATFAMPVVKFNNSSELKGHREIAFWISDKQIYVEYYNVSSGSYQCHIFNIHNKHWESVSPNHCFNFLQYPVGASVVEHLGNHLYAISSSAGGEVTFRVIKWTYKKGNNGIKLPEFWVGAGSNMQFYYEEQDSSIYVLSTTPLDPDNTPVDYINDYSKEDRILYRWAKSKYFLKTDIKLNNRISLYSVSSKKTAWINDNGNEICTGTLERKLDCYKINLK